jgi:catechol 2,3-dioxygenase-like lactoylglutathione lyase family enzyme
MMPAGLGTPVQVAYAVTDVAASAAVFAAQTGAGPFFVVEHIAIETARVNGTRSLFDHSSAYGQWGSLMVELVEEHSSPIVRPPGLHHLAFMVPDLAASTAACTAQGWPEVLWARTTGGQEFAFCDARHQCGHLIELYEPSPRLMSFYEMVASASRAWDGSLPVRHLS